MISGESAGEVLRNCQESVQSRIKFNFQFLKIPKEIRDTYHNVTQDILKIIVNLLHLR